MDKLLCDVDCPSLPDTDDLVRSRLELRHGAGMMDGTVDSKGEEGGWSFRRRRGAAQAVVHPCCRSCRSPTLARGTKLVLVLMCQNQCRAYHTHRGTVQWGSTLHLRPAASQRCRSSIALKGCTTPLTMPWVRVALLPTPRCISDLSPCSPAAGLIALHTHTHTQGEYVCRRLAFH